MAVHVSVLRREWQDHQRAVRVALERAKHASTNQDLTKEGRHRQASGFAAQAALPIAQALQAARETRREALADLRKITPRRSTDLADVLGAQRLLDQLAQLKDKDLPGAMDDPAVREVVARYGSPLDVAALEKRMPQTASRPFSVAAIRDQLVAADFPERIADHRRRLADVEALIAEQVAIYSRLATGDVHQLAEELERGDGITTTEPGVHLLRHLVDDPRALPGADIVWQSEVSHLKAAAEGLARSVYTPQPMPLPDTAAGAAIGGAS